MSWSNLPYLHFSYLETSNHDPNVEHNRSYPTPNEVVRIYYTDKKFVFRVNNKKKDMAGWGCASDVMKILNNKFPNNKCGNINICYPVGHKNEKIYESFEDDVITDNNFDKILYKYMLSLI